MDLKLLKHTVRQLLSQQKGLLAMDESTGSCNKRFAPLNIPQREEYRQKYREMIVTTPNLENYISGAILVEETLQQYSTDGRLFADILIEKGIVPGIKVDQGTVPIKCLPGETLTQGLDGLASRLEGYYERGARFAKWRAVINISENTPTGGAIKVNAERLAQYALVCQQNGIVPIVEPEVLMDGDHSIQQCREVTAQVHHMVFDSLAEYGVVLDSMILKPNMILPGLLSKVQDDIDTVADETVSCFLESVPSSVPGIAFLSGGQAPELATARLNAMHLTFQDKLPWKLTFSYSRAVLQPALEFWMGDSRNVEGAQQRLLDRAELNSKALTGNYKPEMERALIANL